MNKLSTQKRLLAACSLAFMVFSSAHAVAEEPTDEDCQVESFVAGVQCVDDQGEHHWQLIHASTWKDIAALEDDAPRLLEDADDLRVSDDASLVENEVFEPQGPVEVGDRVFYGVRGDLIELDARRGVVADRVRFPAAIVGLQPEDDDALKVELLFFNADESDERTHEVVYRIDGPPPGQTHWPNSRASVFAVAHDAHGLFWNIAAGDLDDVFRWDDRLLVFDDEFDDSKARRVIARLETASERDPTNPYYHQYIGEIWRHVGDEQKAAEAFEAAARTDGVWRDLLDVSTTLEDLGAPQAGQLAFDRGVEKAQQAGIAPSRLGTLVQLSMIMLHRPLPDGFKGPLRESIAAGDIEEVDRLSERFFRLFPYAEGAHQGWFALADWFEERDRPELAEKWRERGAENFSNGCGMTGSEDRRIMTIERGFLALLASGLALLLLLFLVGLRGGLILRRIADDADGGDAKKLSPWKVYDFVGIALALVVVMATPYVLVAESRTIDQLATAPSVLAEDGLASPVAEDALESLAPSSARDELLEIVRSEQSAFTQGLEISNKDNHCLIVDQAYQRDSYQWLLDRLKEGLMLDPVRDIIDDNFQFTAPDEVVGTSFVAVFFWLFPLALIFAVGVAVGRFVPPLGRWILRLVPGAGIRPSVVADIAVILFVTGVLVALGFDTKFQDAVLPSFARYYELEMITADPEPRGIGPVAWVMIGAVLIAHLVAVIRAWSADSESEN